MSFTDYVEGWALLAVQVGLTLYSSRCLLRRFFPSTSFAERALVTGLLLWSHFAFAVLALGAAHALHAFSLLAVLGVCALASHLAARSAPRLEPAPRKTLRDDPVGAALVALYLLVGVHLAERALRFPPLAWDALHYHLPFVAQWLQTGALEPLYHPYAVLQSHFPATGEITSYVLMAPFQNDFLVGLGGLPLLGLQGLALYRIARRAGASHEHARLVPALYLLTPCVVRLVPTAYVEPAFGAALFGAVAYLLDYRADRRPGDLFLCGMALALLVGIKYTGLLYGAPIALAALAYWARSSHQRAILWTLPFLALGTYWYWRNLALTGNPFYPSPARIFGLELLPGIATPLGAARLGHDVTILSAFAELLESGDLMRALMGSAHPERYELGIGPKLLPVGLLAVLGLWELRRQPALRLPTLFFWLFALLFLTTPFWLLHWLYINIRFAAPALGMGVVVAVTALASRGVPARWFALLAGVCIAPDLFSLKIYLSLSFRVTLVLLASLAALRWVIDLRLPTLARRATWAVCGAALFLGGYALHDAREEGRSASYGVDWELYRTSAGLYARGWQALEGRFGSASSALRIAHTGFGFIYPLYGSRLQRKVFYVDINARAARAFHHYPAAEFRKQPDRQAWLRNLAREQPAVLVVHHPDKGVPGGWPIEKAWADERPDLFVPFHRDEWIALYEIRGLTSPAALAPLPANPQSRAHAPPS